MFQIEFVSRSLQDLPSSICLILSLAKIGKLKHHRIKIRTSFSSQPKYYRVDIHIFICLIIFGSDLTKSMGPYRATLVWLNMVIVVLLIVMIRFECWHWAVLGPITLKFGMGPLIPITLFHKKQYRKYKYPQNQIFKTTNVLSFFVYRTPIIPIWCVPSFNTKQLMIKPCDKPFLKAETSGYNILQNGKYPFLFKIDFSRMNKTFSSYFIVLLFRLHCWKLHIKDPKQVFLVLQLIGLMLLGKISFKFDPLLSYFPIYLWNKCPGEKLISKRK